METYYPMLVDEYSVRPDSCGAGQFRGGCGIKKVYRFLADGAITYQDDRAATFPYGVAGGKPGASSRKTLVRADGTTVEMPSKVRDVPVYEGDRLVFETAGAGGVGDPLERDPEAVAKDVRWKLVSPEAADANTAWSSPTTAPWTRRPPKPDARRSGAVAATFSTSTTATCRRSRSSAAP
jgi:N-methylhydantoinase B